MKTFELQVFVNHDYHFIYIRQPKSSSSTILSLLSKVFWNSTTTKMTSYDVPADLWKQYFVFTVIRNPWSRMASAFFHMNNRHLTIRKLSGRLGRPCQVPFLEFSEDAHTMIDACATRRCCPRLGRKWITGFVHLHVNDQAHSIFLPGGKITVDYIGRTEFLDDDWLQIVEHIGKRMNTFIPNVPVTHDNAHKSMQTDLCVDPKYFRLYNATTMQNIARHYAMDVVQFQYLTAEHTGKTLTD